MTPSGSTNHFSLFYQTSLGQSGATIAAYFRSACEYDLQRNASLFGLNWDRLHFAITVVDGSGGAWHPGECSDTNIFAAANTAPLPDNLPNYLFLRALVVSEIVEILGDRFGWNCGWSNGEGLSRAVGDFLVPCQRPGNFLSARMWLNPPSAREDFVTKSFQGDRDYPSIGCSVLFLNWMHYQLGHPWGDIVRNGADTLQETYSRLTQQTDAFARFTALLNSNPAEVDRRASTSDNVFPI